MEYQGKDLFRRHAVPTTPEGAVAESPEEAQRLAATYDRPVMVKAQVLTGGRGKAGGVKYCADAQAARAAAEAILGLDIKGHTVHKVLVEPASDIAEEYYLSLLHDRVSKGFKAICSVAGGIDIEEVNRTTPEKVAKVDFDPTQPMTLDRARAVVQQGGLPEDVLDDAAALFAKLYEIFVDLDATLLEINPLIKTKDGRVIALDAKVSIDNNALFRHPDIAELEGPGGDADDVESRAQAMGLQYVKLDGSVGVVGNGAGLVMSTLDVVSQAGGAPANFLDVGGGADAETMAKALSLVLSDPDVHSVLINIFGGITRGEEVAGGILAALGQLGDTVEEQLVVRLDGTNAEEGRQLLTDANHPKITPATTMLEAAAQAVALAQEAQR